jgi:hypothetical protein
MSLEHVWRSMSVRNGSGVLVAEDVAVEGLDP